jgi:hypothetical protein
VNVVDLGNPRPPRHYNPLLITVLPKERRSRHPYQLGAMCCLLTLGAWQLAVGTVAISSMNVLDREAFILMNWVCILAGAAGLAAAVIPERIVYLRIPFWRWLWRTDFDATYFRLWEEFGAHVMLFTIWISYGQTVWSSYGIVKGYSLGLAAAVWFGLAALTRAIQILLTLYRAGTFNRQPSAVVGNDTLGDTWPNDGEL